MLSGITIFCEDIREETRGTATIVGVLPDNIYLTAIPSVLPKLALFLRINFPVDGASPTEITVRLKQFDREEEDFTIIRSDLIKSTKRDAAASGASIAGLVTKAIMGSYPIERPGRITVRIRNAETDFICGTLNFQLSPTSAPSA